MSWRDLQAPTQQFNFYGKECVLQPELSGRYVFTVENDRWLSLAARKSCLQRLHPKTVRLNSLAKRHFAARAVWAIWLYFFHDKTNYYSHMESLTPKHVPKRQMFLSLMAFHLSCCYINNYLWIIALDMYVLILSSCCGVLHLERCQALQQSKTLEPQYFVLYCHKPHLWLVVVHIHCMFWINCIACAILWWTCLKSGCSFLFGCKWL